MTTITLNLRQMANYTVWMILSFTLRVAIHVAHLVWNIFKEIVNGLFRVAVSVLVLILSAIGILYFILWLFTL